MVKAAIADTAVRFSSAAMLENYIDHYYSPAAALGRRLTGSRGRAAQQLAEWKQNVYRSWPMVHVSGMEIRANAVDVDVYLGGIEASDFRVLDGEGGLHDVRVMRGTAPGRARLRVPLVGTRLRLVPCHPEIPATAELGLSIELRLQ